MSEKGMLLRCFLESLILIPASIGFLMPVRNFICFSRWKTICFAVMLDAVIIMISSLVSWSTGLPVNMVLLPLSIIPMVIGLLVTELNWPRTVFAFFNSIMLCAWASIVTLYAFIPLEVAEPDRPFRISSSLSCLVISFALLALFWKILSEKLPAMFEIPELDFMWKYAWIYPGLITCFFYYVIPDDLNGILAGRIRQTALVIFVLIMAAIYFFYHFLWYFSEKVTSEQHLIEEMRVLNAEKNRFSQIEGYVHEMKGLRHDLRQHLRVLSGLAASGRLDEMQQYLEKYVDTVKPDYPAFSTNYAVDAIAAYYQEEADKKGIRIDWNIFLLPQLPIDETELCVVIGNLLENAIKATENLEPSRRVIEASVRMVGENMIGIEIRNHYAGRIHLSREGMPAPKDREGIGLHSVSNTVRKNNGNFSVEVDEEWFCVDIIINIPSKQ